MKTLLFSAIFTICGFIVSAQPTFVDTTPSNKNAVIEQFTYKDMGIFATDTIINHLVSEKQGRVFGITIHDYALYNMSPRPISKDFSCEDGLSFSNYFNPWYSVSVLNSPLGMINRGNIERVENWNNSVNSILTQPSCLNVAAKGSIDWNLRQLTLTVEVYYTGNSNVNENYLTVALLQNNLEYKESGGFLNPDQALPNGNYNHLRVLRDIISPTWGDTITTTTQGSFFTKTYTYAIPDTIKSALPAALKNQTIRPKVLLEDLEVIVFVSESRNTIISGNKAEITHEHVPELNLLTKLDNTGEVSMGCTDMNYPLYLTLKNSGRDTIRSITYNLLQDSQTVLQNQVWNSRSIYPFTTDTIAINDIYIKAGVKSLISTEITQLNEKDTLITIQNSFMRHLVENARGYMILVIAPDQFANSIFFYLANDDGIILSNFDNPWPNLSSPGIREYSYDFLPETIGCYHLYISSNLNKGYGKGYFKLLAEDGTVLLYNDGKDCEDLYSYINVTEPYNGIQAYHKEVISVFPNPARSQFTVTHTENASLQLYNMVGQEILHTQSIDENTIINVSTLPQGLYMLKVVKDGAVSMYKIVVSR